MFLTEDPLLLQFIARMVFLAMFFVALTGFYYFFKFLADIEWISKSYKSLEESNNLDIGRITVVVFIAAFSVWPAFILGVMFLVAIGYVANCVYSKVEKLENTVAPLQKEPDTPRIFKFDKCSHYNPMLYADKRNMDHVRNKDVDYRSSDDIDDCLFVLGWSAQQEMLARKYLNLDRIYDYDQGKGLLEVCGGDNVFVDYGQGKNESAQKLLGAELDNYEMLQNIHDDFPVIAFYEQLKQNWYIFNVLNVTFKDLSNKYTFYDKSSLKLDTYEALRDFAQKLPTLSVFNQIRENYILDHHGKNVKIFITQSQNIATVKVNL